MSVKYKEYIKRMLDSHKADFDEFKKVHDAYSLDEDKNQEELNVIGKKIQEIINEWDNKLCLQSEKGGFSKYSGGLSEKFRSEIRKIFPNIDFIGIKVSYQTPIQTESSNFSINKINILK